MHNFDLVQISALHFPVFRWGHSGLGLEESVECRLVREIKLIDDGLDAHVRVFQQVLRFENYERVNPFVGRLAADRLYEFGEIFRSEVELVRIERQASFLCVIVPYEQKKILKDDF